MPGRNPDHTDAELILKLYELRREPVMRDSRNVMLGKFWPRNYDEFLAVTDIQHPLNAAFRQVSTYWEMAYSFARRGIIDSDLMMESGQGEGIFLFAKIKPYLERFRKESSPVAFLNVEWICSNCELAAKRLQMFESRVAKMIESAGR